MEETKTNIPLTDFSSKEITVKNVSNTVVKIDNPTVLNLETANKLRLNHPDRIPVIIKNADQFKLCKNRYLVPNTLKFGSFINHVREAMKIKPEEALFFFTESNTIPPSNQYMEEIYRKNINKNGFLMLNISKESTFG